MKQYEIFFNTVPLQGELLHRATYRADKQNGRVLVIFNLANRSLAAHEVWQHYKTKYNEPNTPLTSIRRSITTLERAGELQMTGDKAMGLYGVLVNKWKVR